MVKKPLPKFSSEAEEARWYAENRDQLDDYFEDVEEDEADERLSKLPPREVAIQQAREAAAKHAKTQQLTVRFAVDDVESAKVLAEKKGLKYQTYIKMLLHEAIAREKKLVK